MTLAEMRENLRKGGFSPKLMVDMRLEIQRRFALPFACFVFALLAVPLGVQNQRSGKAAGFTLSIMVILLYYITLTACYTVGEKGLFHPALAIWFPNALFLVFGILLFRQSAAERRLLIFDLALAAMRQLRRLFPKRRLS